ncbi:MAG: hypothetical protein HPY81_00330 [Firmicutes bacterium]|nr:hypothetical protein [Bacillota bacterium]
MCRIAWLYRQEFVSIKAIGRHFYQQHIDTDFYGYLSFQKRIRNIKDNRTNEEVRIPTKSTIDSERRRPLIPIDSTSVLGAVNIWLAMDVVGLWL